MLNHKLVSLFSVILIIFGACNLLTLSFADSEDEQVLNLFNRQTQTTEYIEGDLVIKAANSDAWIDKIVYLNGNLTIDSGGSLKLDHTTLLINWTGNFDYVYKIHILGAGEFEMVNNSEISDANNNNYDLEFDIDSIVNLKDSSIGDCGKFNKTGIVIKSNTVTLNNCSFDGNYIGLNYQNVNSTIEVKMCNISDSSDVPIQCKDSKLKFDSCIIYSDDSQQNKIRLEGDSNVTLLSTPMDYPGAAVQNDSILYVSWRVDVKVTNGTDPLENATVEIANKDLIVEFSGQTDINGEISDIEITQFVQNNSERVEREPFTIFISKEEYKDYKEEIGDVYEDTQWEFNLTLLPKTGVVTGRVTDTEGEPLSNANVSMEIAGIKYWSISDSDGLYEITDVPAGDNYIVSGNAAINGIIAYETAKISNVSVKSEETTIVDLSLQKMELPVNVSVQSRQNVGINADNAVDVDLGTTIIITFETPINLSTLQGNITLKVGEFELAGFLNTLDNITFKKFQFTPRENLELDTEYTFIIEDDIRKLNSDEPVFWEDYTIKFKTEFIRITDFFPKDGAVDIDPTNPGISIRVDHRIELDKASLNANSALSDQSGNKLPGDWDVNEDFHVANFVPAVDLEGGTRYTMTLSDGLMDKSGVMIFHQFENKVWSFTTMEVEPEIIITGTVKDEDGNPLKNSPVVLRIKNDSGDFIYKTDDLSDIETGIFTLTTNEYGDYKIIITPVSEDLKTKEIEFTINDGDETIDLEEITIQPKDKDEDGEGFVLDQNMIFIILIIIIIVIILIIAFIYMGRTKEYEYPEGEAEKGAVASGPAAPARVTPPATRSSTPTTSTTSTTFQPSRQEYTTETTTTPATTPTQYSQMAEIPIVTASMYRCPNCQHRLTSTGECFHCQMEERYGFHF